MGVWPLVAVSVLCSASSAAAQGTGSVGGRVVDRGSGEPVSGVLVEIAGIPPALTDARGVFVLRAVPIGERELRFEHLAYGEHSRHVLVEERSELVLDVVISTRAIELSPLLVETLSELEQRRVSSGHAINEVLRLEIEQADRAGLNLSQLLQASLPGVLVRPGFGGQMCVTYRAIRSDNNRGDCDGVSVVLDGVPVADPSYIYTSIPLRDIERVEMLSPGQGGVRYGMRSGQSVLLVETRQGRVERGRDLSRLVTGFEWAEESEPYPWLGVFGSAILANAIGVGLGLALADRCFSTPDTTTFALRTRCHGVATAGTSVVSVALPAVVGTLAARRVGRTERSQGRRGPSMVTASLVLTGGYLLLIGGDGANQKVGAVVLAIGVPITLTLSDRIFRVLR